MVDCPLETAARGDTPSQSQAVGPHRCLLNEGVRGGGATSEEEKDRGLRRGSRKGLGRAGGPGRWSAAVSEPVG